MSRFWNMISNILIFFSKRSWRCHSFIDAYLISHSVNGAEVLQNHYKSIINGWYEKANDYEGELVLRKLKNKADNVFENRGNFKEVHRLIKFINNPRSSR